MLINLIRKFKEEKRMKQMKLEAPWYTYQKKVKALFERDPEIEVTPVYEPESGSADYSFDVVVRNHEKFMALDRVLAKKKTFGDITLDITLFDEENYSDGKEDYADLYTAIFQGNGILKDVKKTKDIAGTLIGFVRFQPEVIQFPNDDTSDYNGNWNGLAEDIAREVFEEGYRGISFCTADKREAAEA